MTTAVPALRRIRKEQGFVSGRPFAEALGVSYQTTHVWEHGRYEPLPHHAQRLEALLGLPVDDLFAVDTETADAE
jgi:DNA-binding XRE family transcriptional regulator